MTSRCQSAVCAVALLIAVVTSAPKLAHAEPDAGARALAVQLFDEAEALFAKGQTAQACPKYAESYRLDPQLGALIYLAECYEKNQQLASAWGSFREAEEIARKRSDPRADEAATRAAALEPRLSYLVIEVPKEARVPGLEVLRDGVTVAQVLWGGRAAIDTGKHQVEARAPGYKSWKQQVEVVKAGSSTTLALPMLAPEPKAKSASPASPGTSQRIAALAVGGLGIAAVGVGGFFGLSAQASLSDSKALCNDQNVCTEQGHELRDEASTKALVATITTSVGVAALATAAVLWFTAPKAEQLAKRQRKAPRSAWMIAPATAGWGLEAHRAF
jgi:hypothetical protein